MTEERITLNLYEKKHVWNRYVKYVDYDLMGSRVWITAGNESFWMKYMEGIQFTPDFFVMVTSDNLLSSVSLLIIYEPTMKWSCSGAPLWTCSPSINGMFPTQLECQNACRAPPGPCQPPPGQPLSKCLDNKTIAAWNQSTCQYDSHVCSSGSCVDGKCMDPPGLLRWTCSGAPNYTCTQSATGQYATQAECMAACKAPPPPGGTEDNTVMMVAVALIIVYFLMRGKI